MSWSLSVSAVEPGRESADEAQLEHGDGRISIAGAPSVDHAAFTAGAKAPGLFHWSGPDSDLLDLPDPSRLGVGWGDGMTVERELDMRTGVLHERIACGSARAEVTRFCCLASPGTCVLLAEGDPSLLGDGPPLRPPAPTDPSAEAHEEPAPEGLRILSVQGRPGGAVAAASQRRDERRVERVVSYAIDAHRVPAVGDAIEALHAALDDGIDVLLDKQRDAWSRRWSACDVVIEGDDELQHAVRFGLFHLIGLVASEGEAALGARGTTGSAYRGHVFWDADVFVLPFFAATHPPAARALLRYRAHRLHAARANAVRSGHRGARFPWESAALGDEVTPTTLVDHAGDVVRVLTGEMEEHVTADVAWAAAQYLAWTGDEHFARGTGLGLLVETARYWASRTELDGAGEGHIRHVIGPDEYHEGVDDNAYTNVMARWNLRTAAAHVDRYGGRGLREEARGWLAVADAIVDGYDAPSGLYEQFAGYFGLRPLVADEIAEPPFSAPALIGYDGVAGSQLIKQTDVLMLHLNVPEEVVPGSLEANVAHYHPKCTHESSLSPGSAAEALARAGRPADAVHWLRMSAFIDLPDRVPVRRAGLHTAAMGNTWRALAFGFMGLRAGAEALHIDPQLPPSWEALTVNVVFRGTRVRLRATGDGDVLVDSDRPVPIVRSGAAPRVVGPAEAAV